MPSKETFVGPYYPLADLSAWRAKKNEALVSNCLR